MSTGGSTRITFSVVLAKAGTHIPEPVILGPQHKRVYARLPTRYAGTTLK
jgi:hypothetical protein